MISPGASVLVMAEDGALQFAERLIALLDATRYSATYKLATLLALIDVAAERTAPDGTAPATLSAKDVGRRVIELYWPQTVPYGAAAHGEPRVLLQAPQNDIPAKLAAWRAARRLPQGASLDDARAADPEGWRQIEADLLAVVIGMPLAKLQRFGDGRARPKIASSMTSLGARKSGARQSAGQISMTQSGCGPGSVAGSSASPLSSGRWSRPNGPPGSPPATATWSMPSGSMSSSSAPSASACSASAGHSPRPRATTASTAPAISQPGAPSITTSHGPATPTTPSTTSSPPTPRATTPKPRAWQDSSTSGAGLPDSSRATRRTLR